MPALRRPDYLCVPLAAYPEAWSAVRPYNTRARKPDAAMVDDGVELKLPGRLDFCARMSAIGVAFRGEEVKSV